MVKTYDEKCLELANHFLNDFALQSAFKKQVAVRMALLIQETVENCLADEHITNG